MNSAFTGSLRPNKEARRVAERFGRNAESAVAETWQERGYEVLARRLRTGAGEIDLVVADADTLLFIEVKARRTHGAASYVLQPRQQLRLLAAAEAAMADNQNWLRPATRFDVALVNGTTIEHIEDAIRYN